MKEEPGDVVEAGGNKQGWNKLPVGEKALDRESRGGGGCIPRPILSTGAGGKHSQPNLGMKGGGH